MHVETIAPFVEPPQHSAFCRPPLQYVIERATPEHWSASQRFGGSEMNSNRGTIPVSFFGIAVGALAFANLWRVAIRVWHLPKIAGDVLSVAAFAVWVVVLLAYGHKWLTHAAEARAE